MQLIKTNVTDKNRVIAYDLLNKLRTGKRVFGSPAEGLKRTLASLKEPEEDSFDSLSYNTYDFEYLDEKSKLEAGIDGENELGGYFEKIIRLDPELEDLIVFASLGDPTNLDLMGHIPDTDFLCVWGNNLLSVDAKNIKTSRRSPLIVLTGDEGEEAIYSEKKPEEPFLEVNSSVPYWQEELAGFDNISYDGIVCIINRTGASITKNDAWYHSYIKPIHIEHLLDYLHAWTKDKEAIVDLELLSEIANHQIHPEKTNIDLSVARHEFGV